MTYAPALGDVYRQIPLTFQILHANTCDKIWRITVCVLIVLNAERDLVIEFAMFFEVSLDYLVMGRNPHLDIIQSDLVAAIELLERVKNKL